MPAYKRRARTRRFPLAWRPRYIARVSVIRTAGLRKVHPLAGPARGVGPRSSTLAFGPPAGGPPGATRRHGGREVVALHGLDLEIAEGLGPTGAEHTTTIGILTSAGSSAHVAGADEIHDPVGVGRRAAFFVLPLARVITGLIASLSFAHLGDVVLVTVLGATAFSALGLWLGTGIAPQQIGLMLSVIIAPMLFVGCAYYPWRRLDAVPLMKYLVLVNPLVHVAGGMRRALTPEVPHMPLGISIAALLCVAALFWVMGQRSFRKRAIG